MTPIAHMVLMNLTTSTFHIFHGDMNDPSTWVSVGLSFTDLREAENTAMKMDGDDEDDEEL
jgi:hypothetical protein